MAELGSTFKLSGQENVQVDVEMLDYEFVNNCKDVALVNAILEVLKSGKEGIYPDLIRVTEEKLVQLLPAKDKKRYLSMKSVPAPSEIAKAEQEIQQWGASMKTTDRDILSKTSSLSSAASMMSVRPTMKPVRGAVSSAAATPDSERKDNNHEEDDDSDQQQLQHLQFLSKVQRMKIQDQRTKLQVRLLTDMQRKHRANLEKIKGNESFKVLENDAALDYYTKSLSYDPCSAIVFANRAMAYIRAELFDLAEDDTTVALALDPRYIKAFSRRGLVRFKRGKYIEASKDFREALLLDPANVELQRLLDTTLQKYEEVEGHSMNATVTTRASDASCIPDIEIHPIFVDSASAVLLPDFADWALVTIGEAEVVAHTADSDERSQFAVSAGGNFVRIYVEDEDDEEDEEEEEDMDDVHDVPLRDRTTTTSATAADTLNGKEFRRVEIQDDDDSDNNNDDDDDGTVHDVNNTKDANYVPSTPHSPPTPVARPEEDLLSDAAKLKEEGNRLMAAGLHKEAIDLYSKSLKLVPDFSASLNNRAQAHLTLKNYEAAILDCTKVLDVEPRNVKALYRRGNAFYYLKRIEDSLTDIDTILVIEPGHALATKLRNKLVSVSSPLSCGAVEKQQTKQHQSSSSSSQEEEGFPSSPSSKIVSSSPMSPTDDELSAESDSYREKGNTCIERMDYSGAILHYTKSIETYSSNFASYSNRALAFLKLNRFFDAESDATVVIQHMDHVTGAYRSLPNSSSSNIMKKALYRRALARSALARTPGASQEDVRKKAEGSLSDLNRLLTVDPENTAAIKERTSVTQQLLAGNALLISPSKSTAGPTQQSAASPEATATSASQLSTPSDRLQMKAVSSTVRKVISSPSSASSPLALTKAATAGEGDASSPSSPSVPASSTTVTTSTRSPAASKGGALPPLTPSIPEDPPKTAYELERIWRGVKDRPDLFANYIRCFKKSTFKNVIKESTSPDLLSSMVIALRDHLIVESPKKVLDILEGFSRIDNFSFVLSMLPAEDHQAMKDIFNSLEASASSSASSSGDGKRKARIAQLRSDAYRDL